MPQNLNQKQQWLYWYPRVYGYFYKRVGLEFEVEELTANTLNTVFLAKNVQNINAYTWRVAHNYLVKYINTKTISPMIVTLTEDIVAFDENVETLRSPVYAQKLELLKQCIKNNLAKEADIELIRLCIHEEKTSSQVAGALGISPDNVRQKLSRTLKKLREKCRSLWFINNNNFKN